jgi:hypothetical protein
VDRHRPTAPKKHQPCLSSCASLEADDRLQHLGVAYLVDEKGNVTEGDPALVHCLNPHCAPRLPADGSRAAICHRTRRDCVLLSAGPPYGAS